MFRVRVGGGPMGDYVGFGGGDLFRGILQI